MKTIMTAVAIYVVLALSTPVPAADQQSRPKTWDGLEKMMKKEEFEAAGLDKLSDEELNRLNQWMLRFLAHDAQQVVRVDENIQKLQKAPSLRRIKGSFKGWSGDTIFTLDNGEVWKQRLPSRYVVTLENPEVEISKNFLGFYELKVVKTGRKVGVSRVK